MHPRDDVALEAALRLRDVDPTHVVTVLTLDSVCKDDAVRKLLAQGADEACVIADAGWEQADHASRAELLAAALRVIGFDVVCCATLSADEGLVNALAGQLGVPSMTQLRGFEQVGERLQGERVLKGFVQRLSGPIPIVVGIGKSAPPARYAALKGIMAAKKKPLRRFTVAELGCSALPATSAASAPVTSVPKAPVRIVQGLEPAQAAQAILAFLQERGLLFAQSTPESDGESSVALLVPVGLELVAQEPLPQTQVALEDADTIVSGGRGLGGPAPFNGMLADLAEVLGGVVGASRAAVDASWVPHAQQVGQTGKTVQPRLYLAIAISGAIQHRVGMQTAGTIIAINKDAHIPLAEIADLLVVGDAFTLVPELTRQLCQLKGIL